MLPKDLSEGCSILCNPAVILKPGIAPTMTGGNEGPVSTCARVNRKYVSEQAGPSEMP